MNDIGGFGLQLQVQASFTYPQGFGISQFADDADPLDVPSVQIADSAMGLNGDLVTWSKANPIKITINVIAGSADDKNLASLLEANRPGSGKRPVGDVITLTGSYPDGSITTLSQGRITDGMPMRGVASSGRLKTNAYMFTFQNKVSA